METWAILLYSSAFALALYLAWHYLTWGRLKGGMRVYPFVGIVPVMMGHFSHLYDFLTELLEKSPSVSFLGAVPGQKWLFTANPQHIEHMLKTNFPNYEKGNDFRDVVVDVFGHGVFTTDGEVWKQQRRVASYEFSTHSLRDLMLTSIQEEIRDRLIPTLDSAVSSNKPIDLQDVFLRAGFDNICKVGFGVDPATLSPDFPHVPFATSVDRACKGVIARVALPSFLWKAGKALQLGAEKQLAEDIKVIDSFVAEVIAKRKSAMNGEQLQAGTAARDFSDLLSRYISLGKSDSRHIFSDTYLRDACVGFLVAGRDTSAVVLTWFFWELTRHPHVEQKILDELDSIMNKREDSRRSDPFFSFDEMKQMFYMHAAINESMRLHAPVPMDQKITGADDFFPDGTFVGRGWRVSYSIYAVGRMSKLWGPDVLEFKPERWISEDGQLKQISPYQFPVFNAGPRLCLGKDMAYLQMKSAVSAILPRYKLSLVPGHRAEYDMAITLVMKGGLLMNLSRCQR